MSFSANDAYQLCYWLDTQTSLPPSTPPSGWNLVFAPAFQKNNYAVVLQSSADSSQLAIVIQGTRDAAQTIEDMEINNPVVYPIIPNASIANGASDAFNNVLSLTVQGQSQTFQNFITSTDWSSTSVLITGHSLGGTIASIMAPWVASLILNTGTVAPPLPASIQAVTFAAFAAGNQAFVDYLNSSPQYQANINVNDVVPNVWATTGPYNVNNIYSMWASPGPQIPQGYLQTLQKKVASIPQGYQYIQTSNPTTFKGTIEAAPSFSNCKHGNPQDLQWKWELSLQHNYAYCVQFIGTGCTEPSDKCPES